MTTSSKLEQRSELFPTIEPKLPLFHINADSFSGVYSNAFSLWQLFKDHHLFMYLIIPAYDCL